MKSSLPSALLRVLLVAMPAGGAKKAGELARLANYGDRALEAQCARLLFERARATRAGTRQQVRAAARRFVRRHRRDDGYLRWVLRSVGACSALAVALLGLSAAPAGAELGPFGALTGAANPIQGQDVGAFSRPALADLDADGDLDLIAGETDPVLNYFENTGSAIDPEFIARTGAANPFDGATLAVRSSPAFGDLDGDGDLDVLLGDYNGQFRYFENTGSATSPVFVARTGAANPLVSQDIGLHASPSLGDLDGDGDLDLVIGEFYGGFYYYENTGSATSAAFIVRFGSSNPLNFDDVGDQSTPALGDVDGDGDLDLIAGESNGTFLTFENTGSATSPVFLARTGAANPLTGQDVGYSSAPSLGDLDGDGDPDLVAGEFDGVFNSFKNFAGDFVLRTGAANPLVGQNVGIRPTPTFADLDGDGDRDVVAGEFDGTLHTLLNTGSATNPAFLELTGGFNPFAGRDVGSESAPSLGDLEGDGDLDLVVGEATGSFFYFENTGSSSSPIFVPRTGSANPFDGFGVAGNSHPVLVDLDNDGDVDLVAGDGQGTFSYFENTDFFFIPEFVQRFGAANPLDGEDVGSDSSPSFDDLDGDGDLDLVAGEAIPGIFNYFENTGSAASPAFAERTGAANPLDGHLLVQGDVTPALGDLDGDGDADLVAGDGSGPFHYFENIAASPPLAFEPTGAANPLASQDVGYRSTPSLGDLDHDGDLDLVAGEISGTFRYAENTGSATSPAFIARTGAANPMNGQTIVGLDPDPTVALGDLDGDGDLDLVAGEEYGTFFYFENTGTATSPAFTPRTGTANPLDGYYNGGRNSSPALGDLDGDGDLDLVAGNYPGSFLYYENTGTATSPAFTALTGAANPLDGENVGSLARPALGDFDGDGDLDLVAGELYGSLLYFQNAGSATTPTFVQLTGAANPLDGEDVGGAAAPAAGDLNGDGDLDLATGKGDGSFAVHYFPEPARGLLLGAGIALLKGLQRLRRRRES